MMPRDGLRFLVVIPHRNGQDLLEATVRSALAACTPLDKVVVVDNASSDGSATAVAELFPEMRLIRNARNRGFAGACNQGASSEDSRYLLFLNSDAQIPPNTLDEVALHMQRQPGLGQLGLQLVSGDGRRQRSSMMQPSFWTELGLRKRVPKWYRDPVSTAPVESLVGACVAMPTHVFRTVGGWNEAFFFYEEDLDLSRRVREAGFEVLLRPDLMAVHARGASTAGVRLPAQLEALRSRFTFIRLHFSGFAWLLIAARVASVGMNALGAALVLLGTLGLHPRSRTRAWRLFVTVIWLLLLMRPNWGLSRWSDKGLAASGDRSCKHQPSPQA